MCKKLSIFFLLGLCILKLYANDCELINFNAGYHGLLKFVCHQDISLQDNKLIFYIVGKNVKIEKINVNGGKIDYDMDKISKNINQVTLNISTESLFIDLDFIAYENQPIKLFIEPEKKSNLDYKILFGGVVKNSYNNKVNKNNNLQFHRNNLGEFFVFKNGLECFINESCKDKVKISNNCGSQQCNKINQKLSLYKGFGIIHQRFI